MNKAPQHKYVAIFGVSRTKVFAASFDSARKKACLAMNVPKGKQSHVIVALETEVTTGDSQ